ncbi:hypothetical protein FQA47_003883 [Oryzias melastigma]|uniref:Uncharacterized protein n=1 Tax=Oryzias melastigma TaxID=30732 RepID=A0A834CBG7_ORYME|nr:hypothetical protein FQA47_003883 [Oryzias melastigma]
MSCVCFMKAGRSTRIPRVERTRLPYKQKCCKVKLHREETCHDTAARRHAGDLCVSAGHVSASPSGEKHKRCCCDATTGGGLVRGRETDGMRRAQFQQKNNISSCIRITRSISTRIRRTEQTLGPLGNI